MSEFLTADAWSKSRARWALVTITLVSVAILATSCGGGSGTAIPTAPVVRIGTGSVPAYDAVANMLSLPQLKIDGSILPDVKLRFDKNGSWALVSSGALRPSTVADTPGSVLAAPGNITDLSGGRTSTTLTIARLHAGTRVLSNVVVRLTGKTWALIATPDEVKTLKPEDFTASSVMTADESHHVILKSGPQTGVQEIPMHLSSRSYRFCMDAQAEGADSSTMLDAAGRTVFTLKAGEPCVTINASNGAYTLQHRYGGTGSTRTVFLRNRANTAAVAANAATFAASHKAALSATATLKSTTLLVASKSSSTDNYPGEEYWSVRRAGDQGRLNFLGVVCGSSSAFPAAGAGLCSAPPVFGFQNLWLANTFMAISKDAFGSPLELGAPLAASPISVVPNVGYPRLATQYILDTVNADPLFDSASNSQRIVTSFFQPKTNVVTGPVYALGPDFESLVDVIGSLTIEAFANLATYFPYSPLIPSNWTPQPLQIIKWGNSQFELMSNGQRVVQIIPANSGSYLYESNNEIAVAPVAADSSKPTVVLQPTYRYFPAGIPSTVSVGIGEVAFFTGINCSGAAVISAANLIPYLGNIPYANGQPDISATNTNGVPLFEPTFLPNVAQLGTSFQLGLQTSAVGYGQTNYQGTAQKFEQLTCQNATNGMPSSLSVSVDTIEMVMSTDICEYCNLAGADFTGLDLSNVKLQHSNLNSTILSNANLSAADLRSVTLQSATLLSTNLEGASLCSAQLNALPGRAAATLTGAHLKNTNLAGATLSGVKFSYASFYSATPGSCQTDRCGTLPSTCAGAYGATIDNAKFDSSYLSNVDMSNATGVAVDFSNAAVLGVSFKGAKLSGDTNVGTAAAFNNAWLQGSDFTNADLKFADFTGAKFDPSSSCVQALLPKALGSFGSSTVPSSTGSATCVKGQPSAAFCVQTLFTASPAYPATDCTNLCADGTGRTQSAQQGVCPSAGAGGCSTGSWANPQGGGGNASLPTSSCNVAPLLCGDGFTGSTVNQCW